MLTDSQSNDYTSVMSAETKVCSLYHGGTEEKVTTVTEVSKSG